MILGKNLIIDSNSKQCFWDKDRHNVYDKSQAVYTSFTEFIEKITHVPVNSCKYGRYQFLIRDNHIANGWLIKKKVLKKMPQFTPEAPLEDWWFMLQISKISKIRAIPEVTYYYRWHGTNTIKQTQKMVQLGKKTMDYEKQTVMKDWKYALYFKTVKWIFNFYFIRLYKIDKDDFRLKILEIFGHGFVLKRKRLKKSPLIS